MSGRTIEWPPGSGRTASYDDGEFALLRSLTQRCERGEITQDQLGREIGHLHDAKVELEASLDRFVDEQVSILSSSTGLKVPVNLPVAGTLFDEPASRAAKEEAMGRVDAHADADWKVRARKTVETLCRTMDTFTADDVWGAGLEKPREPRALGPVMLRARKDGWCEPTGNTVKSKIPQHHQYPMTEYRSLLRKTHATD